MATFELDFSSGKEPHVVSSNVFETYQLADFDDVNWEQRNIPPHGKH
jgi:hypothetical protein